MRLAVCSRFVALSLALTFLFSAPRTLSGQALASAGSSGGGKPTASRFDIYGGWGYWHPFNSTVGGYSYQPIYDLNTTMSLSYFLTYHLGVQVEGQYFSNGYSAGADDQNVGPCKATNCDQNIYSGEAGPIFRLPHGLFTPYVHALGGGVRMNGPAFQRLTWGYGITAGGGLDINLPFHRNLISLRPIQADYQYNHINYGTLGRYAAFDPPNTTGGIGNVDALKLSAGVVFHFGEIAAKVTPLILGCSASPVEVNAGDVVTVTSSVVGLKGKKQPVYTWAAKGGKVTPMGSSATVDTTGLAPGQYDVVAKMSVGSKLYEQAFCSAPFTVKNYEPPTISCSAVPSSARPGTPVTIDSDAKSPQGRPLTYTYTATGGQVTGDGPTARLDTAGMSNGVITVTCTVTDDAGNSAQSTTEVSMTKPPAPKPPPSIEPLCSLSFGKDQRRPVRVDNEAKACLDDVALALQRQSDATLVMIGNEAKGEPKDFAAERALNAREYLTKEKGIDAGRIQLRTGTSTGKSVEDMLVPPGVTFDPGTTQSFDESAVKRHGQAYPGAKTAVKRHKAKPATTTP